MQTVQNVVVLISGRGSNLEALVAAHSANPRLRFTAVISNRADAAGLAYAQSHGLKTETLSHRDFQSREEFDTALAARIDAHAPQWVVLAGFNRILTEGFVRHYEGRLINIHPSLLPSFPGLDTHRRALEEGVKMHGCSVHFVTPALDHGPIICQAATPVYADDTPESLAARVLSLEHRIYPQALAWCIEGCLVINDGVVRVNGESSSTEQFPQFLFDLPK